MGPSRISVLFAVLAITFSALGCGGETGAEPASGETSQDELATSTRIVGDYERVLGKLASLKLERNRDRGRTKNLFEMSTIVRCARAPCRPVPSTGTWSTAGTKLHLDREGRDRLTFGFRLNDDTLTLLDADGLEVAQLQKRTSAEQEPVPQEQPEPQPSR